MAVPGRIPNVRTVLQGTLRRQLHCEFTSFLCRVNDLVTTMARTRLVRRRRGRRAQGAGMTRGPVRTQRQPASSSWCRRRWT